MKVLLIIVLFLLSHTLESYSYEYYTQQEIPSILADVVYPVYTYEDLFRSCMSEPDTWGCKEEIEGHKRCIIRYCVKEGITDHTDVACKKEDT